MKQNNWQRLLGCISDSFFSVYSHVNHIVLYSPRCLNVPLTGCSGRWSGMVWSPPGHTLLLLLFLVVLPSLSPPSLPLKTIYGLLLFSLLVDLFRVVLGDSSAVTSWSPILGSFLVDLAQNVFFHSLWAGNDRQQCDKDLWSWSNGQKVDIYDGQSERQCSALDTLSTKDNDENDDITWIEQHSHNQSNRLILLFVVHFHCS